MRKTPAFDRDLRWCQSGGAKRRAPGAVQLPFSLIRQLECWHRYVSQFLRLQFMKPAAIYAAFAEQLIGSYAVKDFPNAFEQATAPLVNHACDSPGNNNKARRGQQSTNNGISSLQCFAASGFSCRERGKKKQSKQELC